MTTINERKKENCNSTLVSFIPSKRINDSTCHIVNVKYLHFYSYCTNVLKVMLHFVQVHIMILIVAGLLITSGFDNKLLSWDVRTKKASSLSRSLDEEIESMSISGFKVTVGIGASAHVFDFRNFDKPTLSMEPCSGTQLRCVSSIPYAEGFAAGSMDGRVALHVSNSSNLNDTGYAFRYHPKSKDGRYHLTSINDIAFSPLVSRAFVTGNDEGYVSIWDARSTKRLIEFPRYSNSVASLSYNHSGQLLAVASSYTYREAKEKRLEPPQVFIHKVDDINFGSSSA
ncbi:hypothetical protein KIW84_023728 [Lathyrus oleraceus]|uniref:Uncharacterized protein n=1 Tax=Pisum sativum TaxID=3888 RepID=A0A9D5BBJ0_PEA|nr:hypothetical protein KIW84_023728 [Pisum sativum]